MPARQPAPDVVVTGRLAEEIMRLTASPEFVGFAEEAGVRYVTDSEPASRRAALGEGSRPSILPAGSCATEPFSVGFARWPCRRGSAV
jgi:hypothetical protein